MIALIILSAIIIVSGPMSQLSYALDAVQQTKQKYAEVITSRLAELKADQQALEVGNTSGTTSASSSSLCYASKSTRAAACTFDEQLRDKLKDILRKQILALQDTQNRVNDTNDPLQLKNLGKSLDAQYGLNWVTVAQARAIIALEATNTSLKKAQEGWTTASTNYARVAECSQYLSGGETKDKETNDTGSAAQTTTVGADEVLISPNSIEKKKIKEGNEGSTELTFLLKRTGNIKQLKSSVKWAFNPLQGSTRKDIADNSDVIVSETSPLSGVVSFDTSQETATIKMSIKGDTDIELDEELRISLSEPSKGTVLWGGDKNYLDAVIQNDDGATPQTNTEPLKPAVCEGLDPAKVTATMIQEDVPATLNLNTFLNTTASTTLDSLTAAAEARTKDFTKKIESIEAQIGQGGLASIGNVASANLQVLMVNGLVGTIETTRKTLDTVANGLVALTGTVESSLKNMASFVDKLSANVLARFMYQPKPISAVVAPPSTAQNVTGTGSSSGSDGSGNTNNTNNTTSSNTSQGAETGAFVPYNPFQSTSFRVNRYLASRDYCRLDISRVQQDTEVSTAATELLQICNSKMPNLQALASRSQKRPIQIMVVGKGYKDSNITDEKWCNDDTKRSDVSRTFTDKARVYVCGVGHFKKNPTDNGWIIKEMTRFTQRYANKNPKQWYVDAIPLLVQKRLGFGANEDTIICKANETFESSPTCAASFLQYLTSYDTWFDPRKMLTTIHLRANGENTNINSFILSKASSKDKVNYSGLQELFDKKCKNNSQCQNLSAGGAVGS